MKNKRELLTTIGIGVCIGALLVMGVQKFFQTYQYQKPLTLSIGVHIAQPFVKRGITSPVPSGPVIITPAPQKQPKLKTLSPIPTKTPPKKKTMVKQVFASDTKLKSYPYKEKVAYMDQGQRDVMTKVESTAGDAYAELIFRESGFHPTSVNSIGACGLGQALPCSKMNCELTDVDCQINWVKSYVERRYGTIDKALEHHDVKGWY